MNNHHFYKSVLMSALIIITVFAFISCGEDGTVGPGCGDWEEISIPGLDLIVQNNVWGKGTLANYSQCIFKESDAADLPFGWNWSWPASDGSVKAYPEIIYGHKPWSASSTTSYLPIQISSVTSITASYDITQSASGTYNLAFDIWINSANPPSDSTIEQEIMIWLDNNVLLPAGSLLNSPVIDGEEYDFYKTEFTDWTYIAFRKTTPEFIGDTKINLFFDYLVANGHISNSHYCSSIEFGNEIVTGDGETTFNSFSIQVNP